MNTVDVLVERNGIEKEQPEKETPGLNSNDVILGRGSGANLKKGNVKFRQMVWDKYNEEMAGGELTTMEAIAAVKVKVANDVLDEIKSRGGRFLRKTLKAEGVSKSRPVEDSIISGGSSGDIVYEEVSDKEALEKIKQTLRFQIERRRTRGCNFGSWGTLHQTTFPTDLGGGARLQSGLPEKGGNAPLFQDIDDRLLEIISQQQISRLLHGSGEDSTADTRPISKSPGAAASIAGHSPRDAITWPPLLTAAASAATMASKQIQNLRARSLLDGKCDQISPQGFDAFATLQFLSQHPTTSFLHAGRISTDASNSFRSPIIAKTSEPNLPTSFEGLSSASANQLDMAALIRREELQLMLDRIRTQHLTSILRTSFAHK
ncbi:hypothetical protein IV203_027710 [Nitzschia inconspicua]|uniref:DUF6824 domain-containing protein n=1 Tax=Nitzschia inconspicua TaxID=303405 RepID=A0A9K3LWW4_9STRA|nr:hypothetical protein IV203_027710 [Nitzschia inconspicua]